MLALRQLIDNKAPSDDGFNAEFFKYTWLVVRKDVKLAIHELLGNKKMPKAINCTLVTMIPKHANATRMKAHVVHQYTRSFPRC